MRILSASLTTQRDVTVGVISRPQANIADFYRKRCSATLAHRQLSAAFRAPNATALIRRWMTAASR
nr:hypothetical protein [uncultured Rhodopila sp.]